MAQVYYIDLLREFSYKVSQETGFIDYDKLEEKALDFRPKLIICGGSAYPRDWDYARFQVVHPFFGSLFYTDLSHVLSFLDIKARKEHRIQAQESNCTKRSEALLQPRLQEISIFMGIKMKRKIFFIYLN